VLGAHQQQGFAVFFAVGSIAQQFFENSQQSPALMTGAALKDRTESGFTARATHKMLHNTARFNNALSGC
jgi:hypothetical protein